MTPNTQRTIIARHHGWESASPALLAKVFGVSHQHITAIVAMTCATCGKSICGCRDDEWRGLNHSAPTPGFDRAGGPYNGFPARERQPGGAGAAAFIVAGKVSNGAPVSKLSRDGRTPVTTSRTTVEVGRPGISHSGVRA